MCISDFLCEEELPLATNKTGSYFCSANTKALFLTGPLLCFPQIQKNVFVTLSWLNVVLLQSENRISLFSGQDIHFFVWKLYFLVITKVVVVEDLFFCTEAKESTHVSMVMCIFVQKHCTASLAFPCIQLTNYKKPLASFHLNFNGLQFSCLKITFCAYFICTIF